MCFVSREKNSQLSVIKLIENFVDEYSRDEKSRRVVRENVFN